MHSLASDIFVEDLDLAAVAQRVFFVNDLADDYVVDAAEKGPFAGYLAAGEVQLAQGAGQAVCAVCYTGEFVREPRVLETLVDGDALLRVNGEHAVDQV